MLFRSWFLLRVQKFICSPDEKYAAKIYNDRESAVEMCRGLGVGEPIIAYQKKAGFLSNFLQLSYEPDPSEEFAGRISFLAMDDEWNHS